MTHTAIIIQGHIDPKFLDTCAKTQPTAVCTSQVIVMYEPATNTPLSMSHIQSSSRAHMTELCQYEYLI